MGAFAPLFGEGTAGAGGGLGGVRPHIPFSAAAGLPTARNTSTSGGEAPVNVYVQGSVINLVEAVRQGLLRKSKRTGPLGLA